jgi:hypothetical protein
VTVNPRQALPTVKERQTQAAIDAAGRAIIARKRFVVSNAESSYTHHDSVKSMVRTAQRDGYCRGGFPKFIALALASMRNYHKETGPT